MKCVNCKGKIPPRLWTNYSKGYICPHCKSKILYNERGGIINLFQVLLPIIISPLITRLYPGVLPFAGDFSIMGWILRIASGLVLLFALYFILDFVFKLIFPIETRFLVRRIDG